MSLRPEVSRRSLELCGVVVRARLVFLGGPPGSCLPPLAKTPSSRLRMGLTNSPHVIQAFLLLLLEDGGTESFPV